MSDLGRAEQVVSRSRELTRRQALLLAVTGVAASLTVVSLLPGSFDFSQHLSLMFFLALVSWWGWNRADDLPAVLLDAEGLHSGDGTRLHSWSGAAAIWFGPTGAGTPLPRLLTRLLTPRPQVRLYSLAGRDFDRRAGTGVHARVTVEVPGGADADAVAEAVRRCTSAPVVVGGRRSRRDLERALTHST